MAIPGKGKVEADAFDAPTLATSKAATAATVPGLTGFIEAQESDVLRAILGGIEDRVGKAAESAASGLMSGLTPEARNAVRALKAEVEAGQYLADIIFKVFEARGEDPEGDDDDADE